MEVKLTADLYHQPNGDCLLLRGIPSEPETEFIDESELVEQGYEACEHCFPEKGD